VKNDTQGIEILYKVCFTDNIYKSYELFFDATIYENGPLKIPTGTNIFRDGPLKWPPLLIAIFKDGHLKMPVFENRFTWTGVLRPPSL
jgi:hypothetical protein